MVVDSSAIVAIVLSEPSSVALSTKLFSAPSKIMAAPNALELHLVLRRHLGEETRPTLDAKLLELGIEVVSFDPQHLRAAIRAFDRYGKGRHPAKLNFGDCIAYALAKVSDQALLFVGEDFSKTDVRIA